MRAEAYGRKGEYGKAIEDINVLRRRAAVKPGETRNEVLSRLYPGHENLSNESQQWPDEVYNNSYYAIKVDASYWDGTSEKSKLENYTPAVSYTHLIMLKHDGYRIPGHSLRLPQYTNHVI